MDSFLMFFLLTLGDIATTYYILSKGGAELNPIMRWLFYRVGLLTGLLAAKATLLLLIWGVVATHPNTDLTYVNVLYIGIVLWNLWQAYPVWRKR